MFTKAFHQTSAVYTMRSERESLWYGLRPGGFANIPAVNWWIAFWRRYRRVCNKRAFYAQAVCSTRRIQFDRTEWTLCLLGKFYLLKKVEKRALPQPQWSSLKSTQFTAVFSLETFDVCKENNLIWFLATGCFQTNPRNELFLSFFFQFFAGQMLFELTSFANSFNIFVFPTFYSIGSCF